MTFPPRKLVLSYFHVPGGHHIAGWRHPRAYRGKDFDDVRLTIDLIRKAEKAGYGIVFIADALYLMEDLTYGGGKRYPPTQPFEPLTLLAAAAVNTETIGLAATLSTTYSEPYALARALNSLDHISGGRAGWNIVTSHSHQEARNFGIARHPEHGERYRRAAEFVDVAKRLWDSWEEDAFVPDPVSGRAYDPSRIHNAAFAGEFVSVDGALQSGRSPQRYPILVQAGSSDTGRQFAADVAEMVFTAQNSLEEGRAFRSDLIRRKAARGDDSPIVILPGLSAIVGRTEKEAREKYAELQALIDPEMGLQILSHNLGGIDLTQFELDAPFPDLPDTGEKSSRYHLFVEKARAEKWTLRQAYQHSATARGHLTVTGSAEQVADLIQQWYDAGASDGFNVMPSFYPDSFDDFNELVIPILRERGLITDPEPGTTLRHRLGLRERTDGVHWQ